MPFISAVVSAIGAIGAALGIAGSALASAAIGIGLNFVSSKMQARAAKKAAKQAAGTQFDREYGERVSRKVACGYVGLAGHDVYVNTYGPSNKELQQLFVLADYPCDGLSRIWANGTLLDLASVDGRTYTIASGEYANLITFEFFDGTQTVADPELVANANPAGRWTVDHLGAGICYIKVRATYNQEKLNSFPDFFFEVRGARLYDPRKDSSVGGFGSHRWGDYTTHEFSQNPIVMDYNYRRGFSWAGDVFLGMDMASFDLPIAKYATAANICDETVDGEARYRCSILLDADVDHGDNIDALMSACGGMVIDSVDGSWPLIGTAQPIVATFGDDDLVPGEDLQFQARRSMAELVNSVGGTYPEPANMWAATGYDTQTHPGFIGLDRRTRDFQVALDCVPSKRQANQLASIYLNENRYEATSQLVLPPRFQTIQVGDWIRWTSDRYGDRVYMVQSRSIRALTSNGPRNVALSLQERDGSIYAGAGVNPPVIPFPNGLPVYLNELQNWQVAPVLAEVPDGRAYPAFRLSWDPIEDATVYGIDFQWWLKDAPENVFSRRVGVVENTTLVQEGILGGELYVLHHKLVADRVTNWSADKEVYSPVGFGDLSRLILEQLETLREWINDDLPGSIAANAQAVIDEAQARAEAIAAETEERVAGAIEQADRYRSILSDLAGLRDYIAELDFAQFRKSEQIRTSLTARIGSVVASFDERITAAVSDTAALVIRTTALEASSGALSASIQQVEQASVSRDQALATQLSQISAGTDNQFDSARLWLFDQAVEGWSSNLGVAASGGFLRLGNGANPQALSPAGLGIAANASRQVRARIRKTGNPTWVGTIWWRAASEAWDASRRLTIAQPVFDVYSATNITGDMPWTGTVDQIRLDLSAAQSATDYFEVDWVSIGSPSPGASRAELVAEQTARASGDNANAQAITALQALFQNADGEIDALATGVSGLSGDVQLLEDGLAAQAQALTAVETELADKASTTALATLEAEVEALGGGGIVSQGQAITALRNEVALLTAELADQGFAAFLSGNNVRNALTTASQTLSTRIDVTNGTVDVLAQAVTLVQAQLPDKASAQAMTALTTRVTAAEGSISSNAQALTQVQTSLNSKANASALVALTGRVTEAESDISSLSNAVLNVESSLAGKADSGALVALSSSVDYINQVVSQQADALFQVQAGIGTMAQGRFAMSAYSAGDGSFVRMAAVARLGNGDNWREAGWFIDVPVNGGPSSMLVYANRFAFVDGGVVPFAVEGGVTYMQQVNIERAVIGNLVVGTHNIQTGAITSVQSQQAGVGNTFGPSEAAAFTLTVSVDHPLNDAAVELTICGLVRTLGPQQFLVRVVCLNDGFNVLLDTGPWPLSYSAVHRPAGRTSSTYQVRFWSYDGPNPAGRVDNPIIIAKSFKR